MSDPHRERPAATELQPHDLYRACDLDSLGFRSTAEIDPLTGALGQDDAMSALDFGLAIDAQGYNIFAVGAPGSGRFSFIRRVLQDRAAAQPAPSDWCYVFNFDDPRRPLALELPAGRAREFARGVADLISDLRKTIPEALRSDDVAARRAAVVEGREKPAAEVLDELRREIEADDSVALVGSANALMVVPARGGEPLTREAYLALDDAAREEIDQHVRDARARLFSTQRTLHELQLDAQQRVMEVNQDVAMSVVEHRVALLKERFGDVPGVERYLDRLARDVVHHTERFSETTEGESDLQKLFSGGSTEDFFRRYEVNVMVARDPEGGAPVIEEPNPTLTNLLGKLERQMHLGAMVTDFTRIAAGALHRANGGYLILDAADLMTQPLAWPALKRALHSRKLQPGDVAAELGLAVADGLDPQPIEPRVKVVLVGDDLMYDLLHSLDPEFRELFKVKADFRPHMERSRDAEIGYARFVAATCAQESLPAFRADAVGAIVEEGSREAGDQRKLSTQFGQIADLVREAAYWARSETRQEVTVDDVECALAKRDRRNRRIHRELLDLIERDILTFEPWGEAVGQLFGIGLMSLADGIFGRPIRVMASAFLGTAGVVNIEREARRSGPIHSKGFLVLSGYLGHMFARKQPLILSANLSFDQMYEEVEGDSASVAELVALLSAIGGIRMRQGIAVTGALNQTGLVLPVGGVTHKIEGFFGACERAGLDGKQGVILPRRNRDHLVLRRNVRDAVASGKFHIYAVDRVEDVWPILAGMPAGAPEADGSFPENTVNRAVAERLEFWANEWRRFDGITATAAAEQEDQGDGRLAAAGGPGSQRRARRSRRRRSH